VQLPPSDEREERSGAGGIHAEGAGFGGPLGRKCPPVSPISWVPSGVMKGQGKLPAPCRVTGVLAAARLVPGAAVLSRRICVGTVRITPPG
jgi:hypothetical protein